MLLKHLCQKTAEIVVLLQGVIYISLKYLTWHIISIQIRVFRLDYLDLNSRFISLISLMVMWNVLTLSVMIKRIVCCPTLLRCWCLLPEHSLIITSYRLNMYLNLRYNPILWDVVLQNNTLTTEHQLQQVKCTYPSSGVNLVRVDAHLADWLFRTA